MHVAKNSLLLKRSSSPSGNDCSLMLIFMLISILGGARESVIQELKGGKEENMVMMKKGGIL